MSQRIHGNSRVIPTCAPVHLAPAWDCVLLRSSSAILDVSTFPEQEKHRQRRGKRQPNLLFRTLLALHWRNMVWQFFWTSGEVAIRWGWES